MLLVWLTWELRGKNKNLFTLKSARQSNQKEATKLEDL